MGGGYDELADEASVNNGESASLLGGDSTGKVKPIERTASLFSSYINLSNTILGTGMLALPYALSKNGLALGSIFIVLSGLASAFGLQLLIKCTDFIGGGQTSYYVLARRAFHPNAAVLIDTIVFIKCFGVAISYLIVIRDTMPDVASFFLPDDATDSIWLKGEFWIGILGVFVIPTAFLKQLNSLRFTSALALIAVSYLFLMVIIIFALDGPINPEEPRKIFTMDLCFFTVMTIYVFGFTCHQNIFSIYNELKDPSPRRINTVIFSSIGSAGVIYLVIGILGYSQFGSAIMDNIVGNYDAVLATTIGRAFIVVLVGFSYALQTHPARLCLDNIVKFIARQGFKKELGPMDNKRFIAETLFIVTGTYLIGTFVASLSTILAFVGAIGSTTMCYILPGLFYLRLVGMTPMEPAKIGSLVMVAIGSFIMPVALVFVFVKLSECD